ESGKTPVNPTDDAQDTGVVVKNPTKDTTVTAKDEDGNDIPVKVDDQGHIIVTPGKNVDGPITVTVKDPSMDTPVEVTVPVKGHEAGKNDNGSDNTDADKTTPVVPVKTPVKDSTHLTDAEKQEVIDKINESNKGNFPEGTKVSVGDDGTATITYPDGSVDVIPAIDNGANNGTSNEGNTTGTNNGLVNEGNTSNVNNGDNVNNGNKTKTVTLTETHTRTRYETRYGWRFINGKWAYVEMTETGVIIRIIRYAGEYELPQTGEANEKTSLIGAALVAVGSMFGLGAVGRKEDK
ncbi:LPXTG cell wall anchor domain-containing protein, partial [Ligilactobacillus hayakitensis]